MNTEPKAGASASDVPAERPLPAAAAGSPCRAAAAALGAGRGFAGWPVSCARTGAEFAGTPAGSLLAGGRKEEKTVIRTFRPAGKDASGVLSYSCFARQDKNKNVKSGEKYDEFKIISLHMLGRTFMHHLQGMKETQCL